MAHLYRLIAWALVAVCAAFLLLTPLRAFAYPATTDAPVAGSPSSSVCNTAPCYEFRVTNAYSLTWQKSAVVACQQYAPKVGQVYVSVTGGYASPLCNMTYRGGAVNTTFARQTRTPDPSSYTCPSGGVLTGSSCVCPSGEDDTGSACVNAAEALCDSLSGTETYASAPGNIAPGASSCNATGCLTNFAATVIRVKNAQGVYVTEGAATFTGATCTYSSSTGSDTDTCPGGSQGTINGIATCVPYDPSLNTIESVKDSTNTVVDGTGQTVTGKTTTTVCSSAGSCTTTTTTTTTINGGPPTTKTETTEEKRDDFCTKNPRDPQCTNSAFAGSCTGGFTCTGDAIQCAVAKQTHELNCTLNKDSPQKTLFEQERSATAGLADIPGRTETVSSASFQSNNSLGASSCIADLAITVMGQSIALPFSDICDELAYLRLVLLACSWFIAYRTVAGSIREA